MYCEAAENKPVRCVAVAVRNELKMALRVTIIEDSRESEIEFLKSLEPQVNDVQMQLITAAPYFNDKLEWAIAKFDPDLIILDLLLLDKIESGLKILTQIKQSAALKKVPVIVCSDFIGNSPTDRNRTRALRLGAEDALSKNPFPKAHEFLRHIKRNMSNQ